MTTNTTEAWRGKVGKMSQAEIDEFLGRVALCRLSCVDGEGWPYIVPTCFQYADGGIYVVVRERSAWAKFMVDDPRVAIVIDDPDPNSQQRVTIRGEAQVIETPTTDGKWIPIANDMVRRYLGQIADDYLTGAAEQPRWLFFIKPVSITTWQGVDWAAKYKR